MLAQVTDMNLTLRGVNVVSDAILTEMQAEIWQPFQPLVANSMDILRQPFKFVLYGFLDGRREFFFRTLRLL